MRLSRRRFLILGGVGMFLGGATVASVASGLLTPEPAAGQPAATPALPPATAPITRTTLVETRTESGILGYGDPVSVRALGTGTLTWMAAEGSTVTRGEPLFKVDELPVIALYGSVPMYRTLGKGMGGADVRQLQENLVELGYAELATEFATEFAADGIYTQATTEAVLAWQAGLGLSQTGMVEPAQVVFTPGPVRIAEHVAAVGDLLRGDGVPILHYTGTTRMVTVALNVADQALAVAGRAVTVTLPDERTVEGVIAQVGTVVTEETFEVTITIADQAALGTLEAAPVDVDFVSATREDVLAVPVAALLALAEGGYGVEIVEDNTSRIVAVQTGLFADGRVEISGEAIAEGRRVGVPR